eukprot:TRINITY_DN1098_c0_g1_i1.p1 TRINITY_DN1098_c0_g1~~TRINITY_DN1098_c0_g1_i1.p1  ORF type:complete len:613 (+),score=199.15 TRINITY_DN1098_c0_g1_i1:135-1973(+)
MGESVKKRMSKRLPLHKIYKVKRKIAEHHRKQRRAARKNPSAFHKKLNKDPGIPNSWPFKEQMMHDLQVDKDLKREEVRQKQAEARQAQVDSKRKGLVTNTSVVDYLEDIKAANEEFALKERAIAAKPNSTETIIKDTSMQAYFREFKKVVELADVIIEVLDARDPIGCRCPDVEHSIISKYPNKKIILLLNKIDLVPRDVVEKWIKYLRNFYPTIAFKSNTQKKGTKLAQTRIAPSDMTEGALKKAESVGADTLVQLLKNFATSGGLKTTITVGIIGFPNVGKSSVINSLVRARAAKVGGTPGVTKSSQEIHLDKQVKLLDTPGIVFPKDSDAEDDIILRNVVKLEKVSDPVAPVEKILQRCKKEQVIAIYKIPTFDNAREFLGHIAKKTGKLNKGGTANIVAAARNILKDWTSGKIPFYTEPPALSADVHVGAAILTKMDPMMNLDQTNLLESLPVVNHAVTSGVALKNTNTYGKSEQMFTDMDESSSTTTTSTSSTSHQDDMEEEDGEEEEEDQEDQFVVAQTTKKSADRPKKQDLTDENDKHNPQTNKNKKEQLKQLKKSQRKQAKKGAVPMVTPDSMNDDDDSYSFTRAFGKHDDEMGDIGEDDIEA